MFFTYLSQVLTPGVDLNLTISKTETGLVVLLMPRINGLKDPAQNNIVPLRLAGTPQDIDSNFFPTVTAPIQRASGLLVNLEQFEKQAAKAAANSKAVKEQKDAESKVAKEKKDKYDSHMKRADEQETAGNLDATLISLQQARLHATDPAQKTVDDRIAAVKGKMSQGSLFDIPATPIQQTVPAETQPAAEVKQPEGSPARPQDNIPDFRTQVDGPVCRDTEYAEYEDFPVEMAPPVYQTPNPSINEAAY